MFRAPAMLLPHESTVAHEQHFANEMIGKRSNNIDSKENERDRRVSHPNVSAFFSFLLSSCLSVDDLCWNFL